MNIDQQPKNKRNGRVSEELIAVLSKESDIKHAEGSGREELSHKAAQDLLKHGINPTVALVRRITNLGSNDAIARDIEGWRAGIGDVLKQRSLKTEVPEPVIEMVESMVNGLWKGALIEANQKYDIERQGVYAERDKAFDAERLAKGLLEASQLEVLRLQTELVSKDEAIKSAESRCAALDASTQELSRSISHLQEELDRERQERQKERERAADELKSTRAANDRAISAIEGDRKYALLQLDSARANERTLADRVKSLEADRHLSETQNRLALNALREQISKTMMENGTLSGTLHAREQELTRVLARVTELEAKISTNLETQLTDAESAKSEMRRQLRVTLETAARNDPAIFEFCDLRECHLVVALTDNNLPAYTLQSDADQSKIETPGTDLQSVIDFCQKHLDKR